MVFEAYKSGIRAAESLPEVILFALIPDAIRLSEPLVVSAVALPAAVEAVRNVVVELKQSIVSRFDTAEETILSRSDQRRDLGGNRLFGTKGYHELRVLYAYPRFARRGSRLPST